MPNPFIDIINQVLPEPQAGLLNGILFGVRANLSKDFYNALIATGTIHIIALSGQNIAILTRIISQVTLPLGRKISILLTLAVILGFVFFVGLEPTIVRAAIMGMISLLAVYFGRQSWSLLGLFLAALAMLLVNPAWIGNISFQLSFLATLGIILFVKVKPGKVKNFKDEIRREFQINLRTTIAAQIFTLPIIFLRFRQISLIAPLSNLLIAWLISPIMILGFVLSIMGFILLPLGQVLGWLIWVPLTFIVHVVEITAKLPFASIKY